MSRAVVFLEFVGGGLHMDGFWLSGIATWRQWRAILDSDTLVPLGCRGWSAIVRVRSPRVWQRV